MIVHQKTLQDGPCESAEVTAFVNPIFSKAIGLGRTSQQLSLPEEIDSLNTGSIRDPEGLSETEREVTSKPSWEQTNLDIIHFYALRST